MTNPQNHYRLVGILHLAWVGMAILGLGASALLIAALGALPGVLDDLWFPLALTTAIGLVLATLTAIFFIPSLVGGIGILRGKSWARNWLIIAAVLNLINFPLGTALGIYTLWVTWPRSQGEVTISGI